MELNVFRRNVRVHKPKITFTPNPKASLERQVRRAHRLQVSIDRAVKRGDSRRAGQLQEELSAITETLIEEKAAIEEMLRNQSRETDTG